MRLTNLPPSCAECHENLGTYNSWNILGHTGPVTGLLYLLLHNRYMSVPQEGNLYWFVGLFISSLCSVLVLWVSISSLCSSLVVWFIY